MREKTKLRLAADAKEAALRDDVRFLRLKKEWPRLQSLERANLIEEILNDASLGVSQRLLAKVLKCDEGLVRFYVKISRLPPADKKRIREGEIPSSVVKRKPAHPVVPPSKSRQSGHFASNEKNAPPNLYLPQNPETIIERSAYLTADKKLDELFEQLVAQTKGVAQTSGEGRELIKGVRRLLELEKEHISGTEADPRAKDLASWLLQNLQDSQLLLSIVRRAENHLANSFWCKGRQPHGPKRVIESESPELASARRRLVRPRGIDKMRHPSVRFYSEH